jgi:hypothetical protein
MREVSSRMLSVKKSLLGAGFGAPNTEPFTRVWEGSGLFSLFLDMACIVACARHGPAHAKAPVGAGHERAESSVERCPFERLAFRVTRYLGIV